MSIIYCDNCQRSIDTDYDLHEECKMNEQLEQTYWEAYRALSDLAPNYFKDMSFEDFIDWVKTATWNDMKEVNHGR